KNWQELIPVVLFAESINAKVFFNTVIFPSRFSLNHLSSSELVQIKDKIQSDFELYSQKIILNKEEIVNFLTGLNKLIYKQINIEKEYTWVSTEEFIDYLLKIVEDQFLCTQVKDTLNEAGVLSNISPYMIYDIFKNSKESTISYITKTLLHKDLLYIRNLFMFR
ncbi:MAG: hypothetical protein PHE08_10515, partial [Bacteroidales bacterium]|nr:hypothetical protein [Bacteroidales bacterium]